MEPTDPPLVKDQPVDAAERSLIDDVRAMVEDGRTLLEAEVAYQKSRAALAGRTAKSMAGWIALALSLVFFALMAMVMGLLLILAPLLGALGSTFIVVLALLGGAAFSGWIAARRWQAMSRRISEDDAT
jgi:uncharacterized membrane protein